MRKITAEELVGKGNVGKPDIPGVSTAEMQRIMDEIPREVIVPAFNELSDETEAAIQARYTKTETDQKINEKVVAIGSGDMAKGVYDPGNGGINVTVQLWNCEKTGSVYALTGTGAVGRFRVPAAWSDGDSFTVNGVAVPAYCGADPADGDCVAEGRWLTFVFDGSRLDFNGGGGLSASKLAQATATENDVLAGVPFYAGDKALKHGMLALTGNVTAGAMLEGSSGYASDPHQKINGNIPVRGAWGAALTPGGSTVVPPGYHNGNGVVTAKRSYTTVYLGGQTAYYTSFTYNVKANYPAIYDKLSRSNFYTVPYAWSGNCIDQASSNSGSCSDYVSYNANTGILTVAPQAYGQAGIFISNVLFYVYMIY